MYDGLCLCVYVNVLGYIFLENNLLMLMMGLVISLSNLSDFKEFTTYLEGGDLDSDIIIHRTYNKN